MTTSVGKSFHLLTTLLLKKCPLTRRRYRFLKIFSGCPLVGLLDIVNNKSLSTFTPYLSHSESCILRSCQLCRVDIPKREDLEFLNILGMIGFSSLIQVWWHVAEQFLFGWLLSYILVPKLLSHIPDVWRTRDLNRFRNISLSINVNVLNMSPTILFAFFALLLICSMKFNLLSKVTPRSFSLCTFLMGTLPLGVSMVHVVSSIYYFLCVGGGIFVMVKHLPNACLYDRLIDTYLHLVYMIWCI